MASIDVKEILHLTPQLLNIPSKRVWYSYDDEADVLYLGGDKGTGPLSQKHGGVVSCVFIGYTQKRKFLFYPRTGFFSDMEPIS